MRPLLFSCTRAHRVAWVGVCVRHCLECRCHNNRPIDREDDLNPPPPQQNNIHLHQIDTVCKRVATYFVVCANCSLERHCLLVSHRLSTPAAEQQHQPLVAYKSMHAPASRVEEKRSTTESKTTVNGYKTSGDRLQTAQVRCMSRN